jgi:hypothetical protein
MAVECILIDHLIPILILVGAKHLQAPFDARKNIRIKMLYPYVRWCLILYQGHVQIDQHNRFGWGGDFGNDAG